MSLMPQACCRRRAAAELSSSFPKNSPIHQITNSPIAVSSATPHRPIALSSPLRFILIRADLVFRRRDRIVGQAVFVDAVAVRVPELLVIRAIAFDRALVNVRVVLLLECHRRHVASFITRPYSPHCPTYPT